MLGAFYFILAAFGLILMMLVGIIIISHIMFKVENYYKHLVLENERRALEEIEEYEKEFRNGYKR